MSFSKGVNSAIYYLRFLLPLFSFVISAAFIYTVTGSLASGLLATLFLALILLTHCLSHHGMKRMKELEIFAVRNDLPRGYLWDRALVASFMVLSPLYFVHLLPLFIPVSSIYVWMILQLPLLIFDLIHIITLGESYRDITGIRFPIYAAHGCAFLFLSIVNLIFV